MAEPLLAIDGLSLDYSTPRGWLKALDDVSLAIQKGTALGLVGESGSGKSSVVMALLGLLDAGARLHARRVAFRGEDLLSRAAALRGRRIGVVFQDSAAVLNPALTIGQLVTEPLRVHLRLPPVEARARALNLLDEMGIARPVQMMDSYPHQLSGGMKQRVVIATALATEPDLLLLDEPTTALDVTVEAQILDLLDRLRERHGLSMLLVSHNLGIVDRLCDRVAVLYAGRVVEKGATAAVLDHPRHPYTKGLMAALPRPDVSQSVRLSPIPGGLPDLTVPECRGVILLHAVRSRRAGASSRSFCWEPIIRHGVTGWARSVISLGAWQNKCLLPPTPSRDGGRKGRSSVPKACGAAFPAADCFVGPSRAWIQVCWRWTMCRYQSATVRSSDWSASPAAARQRWGGCCCGWYLPIPARCFSTGQKFQAHLPQHFVAAPRSCCKIRIPRSIHARPLRLYFAVRCSTSAWSGALPR